MLATACRMPPPSWGCPVPRRDRIVELQEPVVTRDSYGSEVVTWTTQAEVWASFANLGRATERFIRDASKVDIIRMGQFGIIRPDVDFDERWRLIEKGGLERVWHVIGIKKGSPGDDWTVQVKA